ncbi:hypothetical protein ACFWGI_06260 [Streptomyces niveus]|uniref:hypothetical protein n=1 Tax=Streptomyces niveus TaxID=193462 RepID=UPI00365E2AA8
MATDEPAAPPPSGDPGQPLRNNVSHAIEWFTTDRSSTYQAIEHRDGPISPSQLLSSARFDEEFNPLRDETAADQSQALVHAQAGWLIRWMPSDHDPPSLDSAQQAGRAWGVLITANDSHTLPDLDVLIEVATRTGISLPVAREINETARITRAAYNRADLLFPYDDAEDQVLVDDWNRLAACGPELPEAAKRAQDVLELLTARVTGIDDHDWMYAAAQQAAQVHASAIRAQPLLDAAAAVIPRQGQPGIAADQARLVEIVEQGRLTMAATAAARAQAVQEWANLNRSAEPDRTRIVGAAASSVRTILNLNKTLAALDPVDGQAAFTTVDLQRIAQIVDAIGQLSIRMNTVLRTASSPTTTTGHHRTSPGSQHQHPPMPGQSPGGATPRPMP